MCHEYYLKAIDQNKSLKEITLQIKKTFILAFGAAGKQ